jgi:Protein of unknown function (DUF3179)
MGGFKAAEVGALVLAVGAGSLALVVGCSSSSDESGSRSKNMQTIPGRKTKVMQNGTPVEFLYHTWLPNDQDGVIRPPTFEAAKAGLKDDAEVLGIVVNGVARAYRLAALCDINRHIVNDIVNGVPVSVLYCDLNDCARAYTGPASPNPLPIRQAGMKFGDLILKVGDVFYQHSTAQALRGTAFPDAPDHSLPPLPFSPTAVTRTNWREWKRQHPQTEVYLGARGEDPRRTLSGEGSSSVRQETPTGSPAR